MPSNAASAPRHLSATPRTSTNTLINPGLAPESNPVAVIFDFDGTLVDSMGVWEQIDREFFGKYGLPNTRANAEKITTLGFEAGSKFVREELGLTSRTEQQIVDEWNDMALSHYETEVEFKPGALELVAHLDKQGALLAICTSNERRIVNACLRRHGTQHYFKAMTCANELHLIKADPRSFIHAAQTLGRDPAQTVVFEDTAPCAKAAKQAGAGVVVGVRDNHAQQDTAGLKAVCDVFIDSFAQVAPKTALFNQLFA